MFNKFRFYFIPLHRIVLLGIIILLITASFIVNMLTSDVAPVVNNEVNPYYHGPETKKEMALTINVAWGQEHIPKMLKVLKEKNVEATFFFLGKWVKKFPELTKEIANEGHEVGNHGYRHLHPNKLSRERLKNLIKKNEKLLQDITGEKIDLFAPPYGEYNEKVVKLADELGYKTIMWTADTIDWKRPEPKVIIHRVMRDSSNGGIILMHPTEPTAKALSKMIDKLQAEGYKLVTVSELLTKSGD
ncbi:polysaccharide deacetylase family protein [Sporohalobacter salinus]|uniref:polysaccharide deacetylase family protein n=1 Tax=Sporohalobacter salinus TaxID=1494606 RepID=UPI00195FC16D|nr:polysaccharide deacetylase family protein [Sporohalobacter salinus]MBM7623464.1 putative sporulation protein (polysaccharide deacetylase family) [Sporohalobacter salinus]